MQKELMVALGQIKPALGNVAANVDKHVQWIREARAQGADLVVFPELGLTGYQVQDLTLDVARSVDAADIRRVVAESAAIDVVFSFVEESPDHRFYVAAAYASGGKLKSVHRKVYLPNYGMFDEGRYFAAGDRFAGFATGFGRAGMMVCEDAWHMSSPYVLAADGVTTLIVPSSSPARSVTEPDTFGSERFWREMLCTYAQLLGVAIVFVNRVGFEDGISFFGGSGVATADGDWAAVAPSLEESLTVARVDLGTTRRARFISPVLRDEKYDLVARHLTGRTAQRGECE